MRIKSHPPPRGIPPKGSAAEAEKRRVESSALNSARTCSRFWSLTGETPSVGLVFTGF